MWNDSSLGPAQVRCVACRGYPGEILTARPTVAKCQPCHPDQADSSSTPPAETTDTEYAFYPTTGRVIEHWYTATIARYSRSLRRANLEAITEMNPAGVARMGLGDGDRVRLRFRRGDGVFRVFRVKGGRLASRLDLCIDPPGSVSKEPEFKITAVGARPHFAAEGKK